MSTQTAKTLSRQVIELVSWHSEIPVEQISLDSHFTADLNFDSLALVEFVMRAEDEFNIVVPDPESETIHTVRDAIQAIQKSIS